MKLIYFLNYTSFHHLDNLLTIYHKKILDKNNYNFKPKLISINLN